MARTDSIGMFWEDATRLIRSQKKEPKPQKKAPYQFWLNPDYLPGLQEALVMKGVEFMTDVELIQAQIEQHPLVWDIECYINFFQLAFRDTITNKIIDFVQTKDNRFTPAELQKLRWILTNFLLIGFNTQRYDEPMATLALGGLDCAALKVCSDKIIVEKVWPTELYRAHRVHRVQLNQIDLKEPAPLFESLKTYGARLHTRRMQDLPFPPSTVLTGNQQAIVRYYCCNDLRVTHELFDTLRETIQLRADMSEEYGVDLRSKSDAQMAEAVFKSELEKELGRTVSSQRVEAGTKLRYKMPSFIKFQTKQMQDIANRLATSDFEVGEDGYVKNPDWLKETIIEMGGNRYQMGIGGLHSTEKSATFYADDDHEIVDADVTSFYPFIILGLRLFPEHLTERFLVAYKRIVDRRVDAKAKGWKVIAEALKIVINGSFGKFGNPYSILYAPDFLIQVTITGQLCLLMMIEALSMEGMQILQANTDGVVVRCTKAQVVTREAIYRWWQKATNYKLEYKAYKSIHSRDVNSYMAFDVDGEVKLKGEYGNPWNETTKEGLWKIEVLKKSPDCTIVSEAVVEMLRSSKPIEETVRACNDLRKFVVLRSVSGGAVAGEEEFLGETLRWYHKQGETRPLVIAGGKQAGNMVPDSIGACPVLELPEQFPTDMDYEFYERKAKDVLIRIGFTPKPPSTKIRRQRVERDVAHWAQAA